MKLMKLMNDPHIGFDTPLRGLCAPKPSSWKFTVGDIMVIRMIQRDKTGNLLSNTFQQNRTPYFIKQLCYPFCIEIYMSARRCVLTLGLSKQQSQQSIRRIIQFQFPDIYVALEGKPTYRKRIIGCIGTHHGTVSARIHALQKVGGLHSVHTMNSEHVRLLTLLAKKAQPHPTVPNTWVVLPRRNHPFNKLSRRRRRCRRRLPVSTQRSVEEQSPEAYQCQKFAWDVVYNSSHILRLL